MTEPFKIIINQSCAILIDGNNIEMSLQSLVGNSSALVDFDKLIPKLLQNRGLSRLIYFREGVHISNKLAERLLNQFHGSVIPCHKSADIPLTIKATQIAQKVDTIIILSGDSDYVELVRHLRGEGVRVEIAAIRQTTARILIEEADHFTPITEEDCYILKNYNSQNMQKITPKAVAKNTSGSQQKTTSKPAQKRTADQKTPAKKAVTNKVARKSEATATKDSDNKNQPSKPTLQKTGRNTPARKPPVRRSNQKKNTDPKETTTANSTKNAPEKKSVEKKTERKTAARKPPVRRSTQKKTADAKKTTTANSTKNAAEKKPSAKKTVARKPPVRRSTQKKNDGSKNQNAAPKPPKDKKAD